MGRDYLAHSIGDAIKRRPGRRRLQFPSPRPMRLLLRPIPIAFGLAAQFRANEVLTADSVLLSLIRRAQWLHASQQVPQRTPHGFRT
jgi:hypothetical protein